MLGTLTCTRSDALAAGASYPAITLTVNVANNAAASVTNSVSVSGGGQIITTNDTATDPTTINQLPDLTIAKSHAGNFTQGQVGATYTLTATNSGAAATNGSTVTVTDTLPAGLTATAISGTGWVCVLGTLTCTRSDVLAAGASYSPITVTVNVANNAAASVTNTASVSGGGQNNTSNDSASDNTTVVSSSDLSLTKTVSNPAPTINQNVTFTITLSNAGPTQATGITITDQLPAGLTFVSATPSTGTYTSGTGMWAVASLASAANATLQIVAKVTNSGPITNTAEVTASDQPDPDSTPNNHVGTEDDQASVTLSAAAPPNIGLTKTVNPTGTVLPGADLTYTIDFSNTGGSAAQNFIITDPDPANVDPTHRVFANVDFKVGSASISAPFSATFEYSNDSGATWTYTPVSGGGGAPSGYDRVVTNLRWNFAASLSQTAPNNAGNVSFIVRVR